MEPEFKRKFLPPAGFWWYGTKLPAFRKPFKCPWLKVNDNIEERLLYLQAAYIDRYGNVDPRISGEDKSPVTTYRHGKGEYLYASWITEGENVKSTFDTKSRDVELARKWPSEIRNYQSRYQFNKVNVRKLAERLRRNESLTIFLSSPFNGAQDERIAFMNTVFPSLTKL